MGNKNTFLKNIIDHLTYDKDKQFDVMYVQQTEEGFRLNVLRNPKPTETDIADVVMKLYFGDFLVTDAERLADDCVSVFVKFGSLAETKAKEEDHE